MDGFKERLNASVQLKLSFALSTAIILVAIVAGAFSFFSALHQAHSLQDDVLYQIAGLMDQRHLSITPAPGGSRLADSDDDSIVFVQDLSTHAAVSGRHSQGGPLPLPAALSGGLHTLDVEGQTFRVLVRTIRSGDRIAVAQGTNSRDQMAFDSALHTLLPFLILVPILLLIVSNLIHKMFRPITGLSRQIDARADGDLQPVYDKHLPVEIRPFVLAINRLLGRVADSMRMQRQFVADAAHELRSPLTALSLQAERLAQAEMSTSAGERLQALQKGIERGRNLLNQLLSLSRAQSMAEPPGSLMSVQDVYRRALEDLMPLAKARHIDVGVIQGPDIRVCAGDLDLTTIVRNLVDNAIRYTPDYGRVDLFAAKTASAVLLRVSDTGPGIPKSEWGRVFDPFYRVLGSGQAGSGLGLSIVKAIAERLGGGVELSFGDEAAQTGLAVTVALPLKCASDGY